MDPVIGKRSVLATLPLLLLLLAPNDSGQGSPAAPDPCASQAGRTVLQNKGVTVSARRRRGVIVYVRCVRASGDSESMDDPSLGESAFPPPAMALSGGIVAWGVTAAKGEGVPPGGDTGVVVSRFAPEDANNAAGWIPVHSSYACRSDSGQCKVGSVVTRSNEATAWISCPYEGGALNSSRPTCTKPGYRDAVYRVLSKDVGNDDDGETDTGHATGHRDLLDQGRGIDPRSLKRRGDRIYWRKNGRLRSATFR